ncbi:MAG: histidinol-phosphate transaminase [Planctomycetota bacterium]
MYRKPSFPAPIDLVLDSNEGSPPPEACRRAADDVPLHRYPDARPLEARLADRLGIDAARVLVTAGADEALDRACRLLLGPGRVLALPQPTFEMIERYAGLAGASPQRVPWWRGPLPVDAFTGDVNAVVSPNNPTGAVCTRDDIATLAARAPLLLDLAYIEYADDDVTTFALTQPNTLVFRTLSKAWGLAALRIGYVAGPRRWIDALRAIGSPYPCASTSLAIAMRRLEGEPEVAQVRRERARLEALLPDPVPSQSNFVFSRFPDAPATWRRLAEAGIGVRRFEAMPDYLRITCPGDEAAFTRLRENLR